ncbi:molybdenum cofactor guanylyltransferase [Luteitalea sp.]|uniref:molybdenum cofactor guanylyltransferase n=1 Tax=Luteitalea sp. TaxID=2004800 RepID=UPI0037C5266A
MSGRPDGLAGQWTGVVLAGGRSRRFGGVDKTRLPLGGRTLLARALDTLAPLTTTCLVVGGAPVAGIPQVPDEAPGHGPLGGLLTALDAIATPHALILAVDLPFIPGSLLGEVQRAGAEAAVALVRAPDGRMPLCLAIRRDVAPVLREWFERGTRRVRALEDVAPCAWVAAEAVAMTGALWNINDPLTYARALEMAEHDCPAC